jgi:hypothetical protein
MKSIGRILTLFLLTILIFGCDQITNPLSPETSELSNSLSGQPLPSLAKEANYNGVLASIGYEVQISESLPSTSISMGFAQIGKLVDAGTVSVNNSELNKVDKDGKIFYLSPSPENITGLSNVNFDGSDHTWNITGNDSVSAFTGSITSPTAFNLSSPENNVSINKADGIDVTWSGNSSDTKILIIVLSENTDVKPYVKENIPDNGQFTIPGSELGELTGKVYLQVAKYNYTTQSSNGKNYLLISEVVKLKTITLQ